MKVLSDDSLLTDSDRVWSLVHRYYDPAAGQFLSVDPLIEETGQAYAYTGDDPLNGSDPNGEAARNGGRIQVQDGKVLIVPAERWSQPNPPTVSDGLNMVATLQGELSKPVLRALLVPFQKLIAKIQSCPAGGGCPPLTKAYQTAAETNNYHVDLEIQSGRAFVADSPSVPCTEQAGMSSNGSGCGQFRVPYPILIGSGVTSDGQFDCSLPPPYDGIYV